MNLFTLLLLISLTAHAEDLCSPINTCTVTKKTWGKKGWAVNYEKELKLPKLCYQEGAQALELEPDLGLQAIVFKGDAGAKGSLRAGPYVSIELFGYKLTYLLARAIAPAAASSAGFEYRLSPKSKSFVEVSCERR